ncbi:MAG TPA: vWA domain-containing protein, partial [Candidatus Thermoplasmatota archaeon]|nr:vWA domain-containing protein [Candidatus Thermoplasmatota archaeon]
GDTLVYEVGPRPGVEHPTPFTASYMLLPTDGAGTLLTTVVDGKGYFAHRFRAPADAEQLPMDLVMVLDVSGSMSGLKLQQMIDASKQVVAALDEDDRLHVVAFSSDARSPWSGLLEMTPENRKRAAREIDALFDGGGTNIESGLRRGFAAFSGIAWAREEGRFPALVLLTDGQPTAGVTSREELRSIAGALNTRGITVFGIAFGDDADWTLVRGLAADGEGAAIRVPPGQGAEVDLRRFMAALTTPVLRDVRVEYGPGVDASRTGAPVLFAGSELLVVGTFDPARGIRGTVTGWSPEGERRYAFEGGGGAALGFLPRLVAYHEVRRLQEQEDADGATAATTARIKEIAMRHGFVTDHTSLVLTLPPRDAREWTVNEANARATADGGSCSGCPAPTMPVATRSAPGWWPFSSASSDSAGELSGTGGGNAPPSTHAQDQAAVPAPGVGLVVLLAAGVALALARRRGG